MLSKFLKPEGEGNLGGVRISSSDRPALENISSSSSSSSRNSGWHVRSACVGGDLEILIASKQSKSIPIIYKTIYNPVLQHLKLPDLLSYFITFNFSKNSFKIVTIQYSASSIRSLFNASYANTKTSFYVTLR